MKIIICVFSLIFSSVLCQPKPNIIVLMADDLGWNDVSCHGSTTMLTPNIDSISYYGLSLNRHYTPPLCTPSRGSFLTGKYSIHTGLQNLVILNDEPWGLGLFETILPQYLKEVNYGTYLVGKWHLGYFQKSYNPYQRGFDSFYGYLGAYNRYYKHDLSLINRPTWPAGYDMRSNETVDRSVDGEYATELFTTKAVDMINDHDKTKPMFLMVNHLAPHAQNEFNPLEAPTDYINKFDYILNPSRKKLAAVISVLDDSVGRIIKALDNNNMLANSVILFYSDNGSPSIGYLYNTGSNYPFKGQKDTPWEGGLRVPAAIWSPLLKERERVSNQLIHNSDWFPTFLNLAGVSNIPTNIDGFDIWSALSENTPTPRTSIVHNIYDYVSYMSENYKYVNNSRYRGIYDYWIGDTIMDLAFVNPNVNIYNDLVRSSDAGSIFQKFSKTGNSLTDNEINSLRQSSTITCNKNKNVCLPFIQPCVFDVVADPCEYENLYVAGSAIVAKLEAEINAIRPTIVAPRNQPGDRNANPALHDNTWDYWQADPCEYENLYVAGSAIVAKLEAEINAIRPTIVAPRNQPGDRNANPALHDNTWDYWQADPCEYENLYVAGSAIVAKLEAEINAIRPTIVAPRNQPGDRNANPALHDNTWDYWQGN